jgi:integrase
MGSLRKKTFTKPIPPNAELFEKNGKQFVRWIDGRGRKQTAPTTTGRDGSLRIVLETGRWLAKFRDGSGVTHEVSTGCKDRSAAQTMLTELERRAELVRSGVMSAYQDAISDHQLVPLPNHFVDYLVNMRSRNLSDGHISEVTRYLNTLADECNFARLADVTRTRFDRWMVDRRNEDAGARTLNCFRAAWMGFLNWCVDASRLTSNPLAGVPKSDERSDRRRQRRSMTESELQRLLYVARWRPLAEYGRQRVFETPEDGKRTSWKNTPLTFETIDAAVELARERLSENASLMEELKHRGEERQLIYKTMVMTGLRKKELASVKLRNLDLNDDPAFLTLDAGNEKNREGNSIPLRADLADDLRDWLSDRLASRQEADRNPATLSFQTETARRQGTVNSESEASRLSSDELLFKVPSSLLTVLNRDLKAAGIPKCDDRGRTLDIHALRHTFGTHLSKAGVPLRTAQAAMRHSSPVLTANIYTDPRLLDVQGAVEALPDLPLSGPSAPMSESVRATGTDNEASRKVPPMLPLGAVPTVHSESFPVTSGKLESLALDSDSDAENDVKPTKKARILTEKDSGLKSGRHDLNVRPPAPKAGALPS